MGRTCFVPCCQNNSTDTPEKLFIRVPRNVNIKSRWLQAVKIDTPPKKYAELFCCEDHFNLRTDSCDFEYYKRTGKQPRIKEGIVPHLWLDKPNPRMDYSQLTDETRDIESVSSSVESLSDENMTTEAEDTPQEGGVELERANKSRSEEAESIESPARSSLVESFPSPGSRSTTSNVTYEEEFQKCELREMSKKREMLVINMHPRFYLGLPNDVYALVKLIQTNAHVLERNTLITLKKIRLNDPFFRLGLDFGLSTAQVNKIFNNTVYILEDIMKHFIVWPEQAHNFRHLPIPFRYSYSAVVAVIDCFEISIEKPSNPLHQALTWSDYKNANTVKFLISATPFGLINFVSGGYGGRISDLALVEDCDYLDLLAPNTSVLADRGFKHLDTVLATKSVTLVRPPSVIASEQLTKEQVRETRNIASLRVHIERAIGRLREFNLLLPHAHVDHNLIGCLNAAVTIASGIINIQPALLNTTY